ncbi:MAG: MarR family transcriptional regulator [Gammaproteobacteria bacterium]|nr:MarR family transcriptional regulator [Gammaproteobacteria bacterium]
MAEGEGNVDVTMLDNLIGYNLRRALGVQMQRFATAFGPLNIRPVQFSILGLIHYNPEIRQSSLGKALNIERANIVTLLAELEERELVTRRTDAVDRRSRVVRLTPAGRRLTLKLLDLHDRLERDLEARLGSKERNELLKLLAAFRRLDPVPDLGE